DAGAGAQDGAGIDLPRRADARSDVVAIDVELVRLRQRRIGAALRIPIEALTKAVDQLQARRDLPVVLHEGAEEVRAHVEAELTGELRHRRITERVGARLRIQ